MSFCESGKGKGKRFCSQLDVWSLDACVWRVSEREDKRALKTLERPLTPQSYPFYIPLYDFQLHENLALLLI